MTAEPIARYYVESANPDGASFPGVPLDDIPEDRWDALPKWLQLSVDASPYYRKTKPSAPKATDQTKADQSERPTKADSP